MKHLAYAPGKVIITGEHFVVHGARALAAAIERGVTVEASLSDVSRLISESLGLESTLPGKVASELEPLSEALKTTMRFLDETRPIIIRIRSNLPVQAGLGSSAAVAVSTVTAAAAAYGHTLPEETVLQLAAVSERHVHKNPSGIDTTISTYGGLILFERGQAPEHIVLNNPVDLVVGVSRLERKTSQMIQKVSSTREHLPQLFQDLATTSSRMAALAARCIQQSDLKTLGSIVNFHHQVLRWLGISTLEIEALIDAALTSGSWGAKVTGAGGGGSMFAVPRVEMVRDVKHALAGVGKSAFLTRIPMGGVKVWRETS